MARNEGTKIRGAYFINRTNFRFRRSSYTGGKSTKRVIKYLSTTNWNVKHKAATMKTIGISSPKKKQTDRKLQNNAYFFSS